MAIGGASSKAGGKSNERVDEMGNTMEEEEEEAQLASKTLTLHQQKIFLCLYY